MRILLCYPVADFSVYDVARGYERAFVRAGHSVKNYLLNKRWQYHATAIGGKIADFNLRRSTISRHASETILLEAMYFNADVVIIVSGLLFHPLALWLLHEAGFPTITIMTESPYQDRAQAEWAEAYPGMFITTHERVSSERYGWYYLPHAYDPEFHRPVPPDPAMACDVLFVGTGFPERQLWLDSIDWTGIDVRLRGHWPHCSPQSPIYPYVHAGCVDNLTLPAWYAAARVNLNIHRADEHAVSLNPRAYELAACGAFQILDQRAEADEVFGDAVPRVSSPAELSDTIRQALADPSWRTAKAETARACMVGHSFDNRAADLLAAFKATPAQARAVA